MVTGARFPTLNSVLNAHRAPDADALGEVAAQVTPGMPWSVAVRYELPAALVEAAARLGLTRRITVALMIRTESALPECVPTGEIRLAGGKEFDEVAAVLEVVEDRAPPRKSTGNARHTTPLWSR